MKKLLFIAAALTSMLATSCDELTDALDDLEDELEEGLTGSTTATSGLIKSLSIGNNDEFSVIVTYFYNDDDLVSSLTYEMTYEYYEYDDDNYSSATTSSVSKSMEMLERQLPSFFTPRSSRLAKVASNVATKASGTMTDIYTVTYDYSDDQIIVTVSGTEDGEVIDDEVAYFDLNSNGYATKNEHTGSYEDEGEICNYTCTTTYEYSSDYISSIVIDYNQIDWSGSNFSFEWSDGNITSKTYEQTISEDWYNDGKEVETYTYGSDLNNTNLDFTMLWIWGDDYFMGNSRDIYGITATNLVTKIDEVDYDSDGNVEGSYFCTIEYTFDGDRLVSMTTTGGDDGGTDYANTVEISYY